MGDYSILKIGQLVFEWKNYIPNFLTFLFSESDFFCKPKKLKYEDDWYKEIGYSTTCGKSLEILNRFGYDINFFANVYDAFNNNIEAHYHYYLEEELSKKTKPENIEQAIEAHINNFPKQNKLTDLQDFISFLKIAIDSNFAPAILANMLKISDEEREFFELRLNWRRTDFANFESLQEFFCDKVHILPPPIIKLSYLFDKGYLLEYPEIILLMYTRLILEATPKNK